MNKLKIHTLQIILFFCVLSLNGCRTSKSQISNFDYYYQKNWKYFELKNDINIKVIKHIPAEVLCGVIATASITIGETDEKDTIRIINLCNMENYEKDKKIKFSPAQIPKFKVSLPLSLNVNSKTKKLVPSLFDLNVLKTTYGYCIKN